MTTEDKHVAASRRGVSEGPVDRALAELGLFREVVVVVPSFAAALALATSSDLVTPPPRWFAAARIGRSGAKDGFAIFDLPLAVNGIVVSRMWHPRLDADAGHRWPRGLVIKVTTRWGRTANHDASSKPDASVSRHR